MAQQARITQEDQQLVGAALDGERTIFQPDENRPRCPYCSVRLRPDQVLAGWCPGTRRRLHSCQACRNSWTVVDDPAELVDALRWYWVAQHRYDELVAAEADSIRIHGARAGLGATRRTCRDLRIGLPAWT